MLQFLLGGISGLMLSLSIVDVAYHETYFTVGHLHTILGVAVVSCIPSVYLDWMYSYYGIVPYCWPHELLGKLISISATVIFISYQHNGCIMLPRRMLCYVDVGSYLLRGDACIIECTFFTLHTCILYWLCVCAMDYIALGRYRWSLMNGRSTHYAYLWTPLQLR